MPFSNDFPPAMGRTLARSLCLWYAKNARDLPWRRTRDPYAIWISEIMLQQTQAATVIPYFERWMARFPDIESLASAEMDAVLRQWEGLGYYSRARNLHKAARIIVQDLGGVLPQSYEGLAALPGIGPYTAGAVLSIAYRKNVPVVDANVKRVFARILDMGQPTNTTKAHRIIRETALGLMPEGQADAFNQALMELGALVCTPKNPDCPDCPVSPSCLALQHGTVNARPVPAPKKATTAIQVSAGVLVRDGRFLVQKRLAGGLLGGLWEFPGGKLQKKESPEQALVREFAEELELDILCGEKITVIRHAYTRFRVTLHTFWCALAHPDQEPAMHAAEEIRWVTANELEKMAFPAADRRLIRILARLS